MSFNYTALENMVEGFLNDVMVEAQEALASDDSPITSLFSRFSMNRDNGLFQQMIQDSFMAIKPYKKVLSLEGEQQLSKVLFHSEMPNSACPITLENFQIGDEVIMLPCKHVFNEISIKKWLREENNICPLCRYELKFVEVKIEKERSRPIEDVNSVQEEEVPLISHTPTQQNRRFPTSQRTFTIALQTIMEEQIEREDAEILQQAIEDSLREDSPPPGDLNIIYIKPFQFIKLILIFSYRYHFINWCRRNNISKCKYI